MDTFDAIGSSLLCNDSPLPVLSQCRQTEPYDTAERLLRLSTQFRGRAAREHCHI